MSEEAPMDGLRRRVLWILMGFEAAANIFGAMDVVLGAAGDHAIALGLTGRTHEELIAESPDTYRMYDFTARTQAWGLVTLGLLLLGILVGAYRRGETWAWRVMWLLPAWSLSVPAMYLAFGLVPGTPPPPPFISGSIIGVISIVVLLADHRRFATGRNAVDPRFTGASDD
jgi:hypothetical protein